MTAVAKRCAAALAFDAGLTIGAVGTMAGLGAGLTGQASRCIITSHTRGAESIFAASSANAASLVLRAGVIVAGAIVPITSCVGAANAGFAIADDFAGTKVAVAAGANAQGATVRILHAVGGCGSSRNVGAASTAEAAVVDVGEVGTQLARRTA